MNRNTKPSLSALAVAQPRGPTSLNRRRAHPAQLTPGDLWRRLHRHGRAISLTTIFHEHYPILCDMAFGENKRVVLNATYSDRLVRDDGGQDQTHRYRLYDASLAPARPSVLGSIPLPRRSEKTYRGARTGITPMHALSMKKIVSGQSIEGR